jgi:hypothetical protein
MKSVRFYADFKGKREKSKTTVKGLWALAESGINQNVLAVFYDTIPQRLDGCVDCVGAIFYYDNSPVTFTSASIDYIDENCKRIPESLARQLHPMLFYYLEME